MSEQGTSDGHVGGVLVDGFDAVDQAAIDVMAAECLWWDPRILRRRSR